MLGAARRRRHETGNSFAAKTTFAGPADLSAPNDHGNVHLAPDHRRCTLLSTERRFSVFRMIRVGLAFAYIHSIVVVAIAVVFSVVHHDGLAGNSVDLSNTSISLETLESHVLILRYTYFLSALVIILSHGRWTEIATEDVRRSLFELNSFDLDKTFESFFGQLVIVTICFGIATLRPPPYIVKSLVDSLETSWISSAIWSGAMSVVMVAFGFTAVAAKEAMHEPHTPRR